MQRKVNYCRAVADTHCKMQQGLLSQKNTEKNATGIFVSEKYRKKEKKKRKKVTIKEKTMSKGNICV